MGKRLFDAPLLVADFLALAAGLVEVLTVDFLEAPLVTGVLEKELERAADLLKNFRIAHHLQNLSIKPVKSHGMLQPSNDEDFSSPAIFGREKSLPLCYQ